MRYDKFAEEGGSSEGCCPLKGASAEGFANLQPGEKVADFGSGGGIDLVLASHKVGPTGKVIGIDFAPHMIERAKQVMSKSNLSDRVEFILLDIENPEVPDNIADVVISNCVINLCPVVVDLACP